ncbi:MAG: site-specific DNA-methyltransferase [Methanospirillaceae archaeon]|nr:site-specific DNA-methyltransferase [Methanospirillaceae archaeon]
MINENHIIPYLSDFTSVCENNGHDHSRENKTVIDTIFLDGSEVSRYTNAFWTARQRQAANIHEISYRACFKPQLPRFFISLLTAPGDRVYDPFGGRGTTAIESGLLGRIPLSNDINPLSKILIHPRLCIPDMAGLDTRLSEIPIDEKARSSLDLSMFYHPDTEAELVSLRSYLLCREETGEYDMLDAWIRMVATNRLTGHSPGFFSVYTLPPNQATSQKRQIKINADRNQVPPYRNVSGIIRKKSRQLVKALSSEDIVSLRKAGSDAMLLVEDARYTRAIPDASVQLTVTSPPFLNNVQYSGDNWLRCWFNGIDAETVSRGITIPANLSAWSNIMGDVFFELFRITKDGGWVAFEVGEVNSGKTRLDEIIVPLGRKAGFSCVGIVLNQQVFTKTANIWGIDNMKRGTNTNRIVLFKKQ